MTEQYRCKHFGIKELVDEKTFAALGEDLCWALFPEDLLKGIDWFRERYGPCVINSWSFSNPYYCGEIYSYSGIRTPDSPYYSKGSAHSTASCVDMKFSEISAEEIRQDLKTVGQPVPFGLTRVEDGVNWIHAEFWTLDRVKSYHETIKGIRFFQP